MRKGIAFTSLPLSRSYLFPLSGFKMSDSNYFKWYSLPFDTVPCLDSFASVDHLIISGCWNWEEMESLFRPSSLFSHLGETKSQRKEMTWASITLVEPGPELRFFFSAKFLKVCKDVS